MKRCLVLAGKAKLRGDHAVGSVIVWGNQVIGEGIEGGRTFLDITRHAEIEAVRQASAFLKSQHLSACTLYTTHEPCIMCSYVIRHAGIGCVVLGVFTGEGGGLSSAYPLLADRSIKKWSEPPVIISGVLAAECRALNE